MRKAVTIVIPTRNRLPLLIQTLDSILKQDHTDYSVLVCDNCSEDGTAEYVTKLGDPRISVTRHNTNIGLKNNWVFALRQVTSDTICLTSDDDLYHRRYLSTALHYLGRYQEAAFYACSTRHFAGNEIRDEPDIGNVTLLQKPNWLQSTEGVFHEKAEQATTCHWLQGMPLAFNSMCIRTESLTGIRDWGGDGWPLSIDYLLAGQLAMMRSYVFNMETHAYYRRHTSQVTGGEWDGKVRALEHWYVIRRLAELALGCGFLGVQNMIDVAVKWDVVSAGNLVVALASSSNTELSAASRTIFHEHAALRKGHGSGHMWIARIFGPGYLRLVFSLYKLQCRWP